MGARRLQKLRNMILDRTNKNFIEGMQRHARCGKPTYHVCKQTNDEPYQVLLISTRATSVANLPPVIFLHIYLVVLLFDKGCGILDLYKVGDITRYQRAKLFRISNDRETHIHQNVTEPTIAPIRTCAACFPGMPTRLSMLRTENITFLETTRMLQFI